MTPLLEGVVLLTPLLKGVVLLTPLLEGVVLLTPLLEGVVLLTPLLEGVVLLTPLLEGVVLLTSLAEGVVMFMNNSHMITFHLHCSPLQAQGKAKGDIETSPRSMAKLLKESRRLKVVLSANTAHKSQVSTHHHRLYS